MANAFQFAEDYSDALNSDDAVTLTTQVQLHVDGRMYYINGTSIGHDEDSGEPIVLIEGTSDPGF
jgi:hypothetical protein